MTTTPPLTIPARFRGPTSSGNGGWSAGAIAAYLAPGPVQVRLRKPPPLDVPLDVTVDDGGARAVAARDGVTVLEAAPSDHDLVTVPPVDTEVARAAEAHYAGLASHPFPSCFVCGTARDADDGLRIFPGRVDDADGRPRVAATWTPHPSTGDGQADPRAATATSAVTWAALDCAGAWACDLTGRPMVLGSMTAEVLDLPRTGEQHVVVGADRGTQGRRTSTATALYAADGRLLARAEHVWVAVDPADFA